MVISPRATSSVSRWRGSRFGVFLDGRRMDVIPCSYLLTKSVQLNCVLPLNFCLCVGWGCVPQSLIHTIDCGEAHGLSFVKDTHGLVYRRSTTCRYLWRKDEHWRDAQRWDRRCVLCVARARSCTTLAGLTWSGAALATVEVPAFLPFAKRSLQEPSGLVILNLGPRRARVGLRSELS